MKQPPPPKKTSRAANSSLAARPLNLRLDSATQTDMRIEIVPLIDVIFCILVFFLLAAVGFSRQRAISLDLPKATTGIPQMREMSIVSLDYTGQAYLEQQPIDDERLYQAVESYFERRPDATMALYASREVRYERVVEILDILRSVGGDRVALATLPQGAQQPSQSEPPAPFPEIPGTGAPGDPNVFPSYPDPNNPLGPSLGAPPLPGQSPALPGLPDPSPAQPGLPSVPPTEPAPATPSLPGAPPESSGSETSQPQSQ
ncbi:MAG: biopolymer transporter ExbD [Cyanobacteriota bacterium]|nr:biopolymer transporter ExbD [Cyanobacteriota bacterium]